MQVSVIVSPHGKRNSIVGLYGEALKIRVTASPDHGRANQAVCAVLATYFRVPTSSIRIVRGSTSRRKIVSIMGVTPALLTSCDIPLQHH